MATLATILRFANGLDELGLVEYCLRAGWDSRRTWAALAVGFQ